MIKEQICSKYEEEEFLFIEGMDEAILGVEEYSMRIIYSVQKCIEILMRDEMDELEAVEYFEYNILSAYVGKKTPIFCHCYDYICENG